jgi:hypothetical protein
LSFIIFIGSHALKTVFKPLSKTRAGGRERRGGSLARAKDGDTSRAVASCTDWQLDKGVPRSKASV